jgi:hypothetical protein
METFLEMAEGVTSSTADSNSQWLQVATLRKPDLSCRCQNRHFRHQTKRADSTHRKHINYPAIKSNSCSSVAVDA